MDKNIIIVADDSDIIGNIIKTALNNTYDVLVAKNGQECINLLAANQNRKITGLFLDLMMPQSDGFIVLDFFKANNLFERIPVCIISGDDTKETISRAFTYNIIDMINKPFGIQDVIQMVEKMKI